MCWGVHTSEETHEVIRRNLHRAPMFNGGITSVGPRYCPSIETKIVRFAEKPSHHLFLEPEGWHTREIYVQGANTSLPEQVQLEMLRTIPALRECEVMRPGYAIEYDFLPGTQVTTALEAKPLRNLFLAGQIIGTTGYEEAGALGIVAGINAARRARGEESVTLRRDEAYVGVLIDDLVTKEMDEPYRMHTSQAEFRLLLRQDNAEARLSGLGHKLGIVDEERFGEVEGRQRQVEDLVERLGKTGVPMTAETLERLEAAGCVLRKRNVSGAELLSRVEVSVDLMQDLGLLPNDLPDEVAREVETAVKYAGYVARQAGEVDRLRRLEDRTIPESVDFFAVGGLRAESQERLSKVRPRTVGQASRIAGVTSSDIAVLLVHLERHRRQAIGA